MDTLAKEFDDTLKYALKTFSCRRAVGLLEENKRPNLHDSLYSEEDSLNFLNPDDIGTKMFGPEIPEKDRASVARTLEKLGGLWEQKKHNRIGVIQSWRLQRLNERLRITKRHSAANMRIMAVFKKPLHNFYRILAFSKGAILDADYSTLPRVNFFETKSQLADEKMNESSFIFNPSEIFETTDQRVKEELRSIRYSLRTAG